MIVGGVIIGISLIAAGFGFVKFQDGRDFDPPTDSFWDGKSDSTPDSLSDFTVTGDLLYNVWSEDDGNMPNVSIVDSNGEEIFTPCEGDDCSVKEGFRELGTFGIPLNDTRSYTITISGDGNVYIVTPAEGLGNSLLGIVSMAFGACFSICGLVVLIIGLGMKDADAEAVQIAQQAAMIQQTMNH